MAFTGFFELTPHLLLTSPVQKHHGIFLELHWKMSALVSQRGVILLNVISVCINMIYMTSVTGHISILSECIFVLCDDFNYVLRCTQRQERVISHACPPVPSSPAHQTTQSACGTQTPTMPASAATSSATWVREGQSGLTACCCRPVSGSSHVNWRRWPWSVDLDQKGNILNALLAFIS